MSASRRARRSPINVLPLRVLKAQMQLDGSVKIGNRSVNDLDGRDFGYMYQQNLFCGVLTVREHLHFMVRETGFWTFGLRAWSPTVNARFAGGTETGPAHERRGPEGAGRGDRRRTGPWPVREHPDRRGRREREGVSNGDLCA